MPVRSAVIPAAGLGTRFLPATKAVPKELMPIFDTPAIQLVLDEAIGAGIEHVVVVSNVAKPSIAAYLEPDAEVVERVRASGREALADRLARIGRDVRVSVVYQDEPRGLGHAVACARGAIGAEPFAVLLPDELMGDSSLLVEMSARHDADGLSVVALKEVPGDEVSAYGCVAPLARSGADVTIGGVVEKPAVADAPSNLIIIGRYVLHPGVFDLIDRLAPAGNGEIQLSDALDFLAGRGALLGLVTDVRRHDTGTPMGWLQAVIELALERPDVGPAFSEWLAGRWS